MPKPHRLVSLMIVVALLVSAVPAFAAPNRYTAISFDSPAGGLIAGLSNSTAGVVYRVGSSGSVISSAAIGGQTMVGVDKRGTDAWAVAQGQDTPYHSADSGASWRATGRLNYTGQAAFPLDVKVLASGMVVVVGRSNEVSDLSGVPRGELAFINTSSNGTTWTKAYEEPMSTEYEFEVPVAENSLFNDVDESPDGAIAMAVGTKSRYVDGANDTSVLSPKKTMLSWSTDGGVSWSHPATLPPDAFGAVKPAAAVAVSSSQVAYVFSSTKPTSYFWRSTNGGSSWSVPSKIVTTDVPNLINFTVYAADSLDASTVVAVGTGSSTAIGAVAYTKDGGATWRRPQLPGTATPYLNDVQMVTRDYWIAVGENNYLVATRNAGKTWEVPDTVPPVINITKPAEGRSYTATITPEVTVSGAATQSISLNGEPFISGASVSTDGTHTLSVVATDTWNNVATKSVTFRVDVDRTPPVIGFKGVANETSYNTTVTPVITIADSVSGIATHTITLGTGAKFASGTPISADGQHTINVWGRDFNGNVSTNSVTFNIDKNAVAPDMAIDGIADGVLTTHTVTPLITISGDTTRTIRLNGSPYTTGTPISVDGTYTLFVSARNIFNMTSSSEITFVIDKTGPVIALWPDIVAESYTATVTPTITIADNVSGLASRTITLDGKPFVSGTPITARGQHTLEVTARDVAGNLAAPFTRTFTIVRPVVAVTSRTATLRTYGQSYIVSGTARYDGGAPAAGKRVELWESTTGAAGTFRKSSYVATTTAEGIFSFSFKPQSTMYYGVQTPSDQPELGSGLSNSVKVVPQVSITNPYAPSTMYRTRYYTVYSYLKPKHASGSKPVRIYKYRYVSGKWKSYGYVLAKASTYSSTTSKCSVSMKLPYSGRWRLRAYHAADAGQPAKWSTGYDYVTVR